MKDRIKQLMESQHMTQQSFAQALNMSPASLSSIFNDRTRPTLNHVEAIKNRFPQINIDWLLFGKGDMFVDAAGHDGDEDASTPPSSSSEMMLHFDDANQGSYRQRPDMAQRTPNPATPQYRSLQEIKIIDKPVRRVSSIQVIYDDSTIEVFVPKK